MSHFLLSCSYNCAISLADLFLEDGFSFADSLFVAMPESSATLRFIGSTGATDDDPVTGPVMTETIPLSFSNLPT